MLDSRLKGLENIYKHKGSAGTRNHTALGLNKTDSSFFPPKRVQPMGDDSDRQEQVRIENELEKMQRILDRDERLPKNAKKAGGGGVKRVGLARELMKGGWI